MPRTAPTGLLTSPSRCIAAKVIRRDGTIFGITDTNISFAHAGVVYEPVDGISASRIEQDSGTAAGDLEITTIESLTSSKIKRGDILAGFYQGCRVWLYEYDYMNPGIGPMIKGQYVMTNAAISDAKIVLTFKEILWLLRMATGRIIQPTCDVATTFDKRCDPSQVLKGLYTFSRTVTNVIDPFTIEFGSETNPVGYYNFGVLEWTSGANLPAPPGTVKVHLSPGGSVARIVLNTPFGYPVQVGDVANLTRGCNKLDSNCKAIANPDTTTNPSGTNIENFQGFNGIPLPDDLNKVGRQAGM